MIELVVVVAVLACMAAIGIPTYTKFHSKARQSEAKMALAALFTAEESFHQEWNQFSVTLINIGFGVQGSRLRYKTGFPAAACVGYSTALGAPIEVVNTANSWSDGASANTTGASWSTSITEPANSGASCASGDFTAASYGNPATVAADPGAISGDTWTMTETKQITNTQLYLGN